MKQLNDIIHGYVCYFKTPQKRSYRQDERNTIFLNRVKISRKNKRQKNCLRMVEKFYTQDTSVVQQTPTTRATIHSCFAEM